MPIHVWGTVRSPTSWSHVTRELILALDQRGHDISITACRGFLHDSQFPLHARLSSLLDKPRSDELTLAFEYPPNYWKISGKIRAGLLVYETTVLPAHWVESIMKYPHVLIVPSRFCARIMTDSGIPETMVEVAPYGVRPELFHRDVRPAELPSRKKFNFLTVAMPHKRKGIDILLQAYAEEFSACEDVCLILKSSYKIRDEKLQPWEVDLGRMLQEFKNRPKHPEIISMFQPVSAEAMPALYAACDCYVQPSRSEGFGLAILEAFACGKTAIVTGWGGHMDFCNESNSYLLKYDLERARDVQYDNDSTEALCAVPDVRHLRALMREAYSNRGNLKKRSGKAFATAVEYPWTHSAEKIEEILAKLSEEI